MQDINIKITDRDGVTHKVVAPTDMAMNLMEVVRSYELAAEGNHRYLWRYGNVCFMSMLCNIQSSITPNVR